MHTIDVGLMSIVLDIWGEMFLEDSLSIHFAGRLLDNFDYYMSMHPKQIRIERFIKNISKIVIFLLTYPFRRVILAGKGEVCPFE